MSSPGLKSLLRRHLLKTVFSTGSFTVVVVVVVVVVSQSSSRDTGQRLDACQVFLYVPPTFGRRSSLL